MKYRIKNWTDYQHYKDRCPPWIKLHNSLLTSEVWVMGNDATRTLAIACMLLSSRNEANDGTFNGEPEYIKRFAYLNSKPYFKPLIDNGFIEVLQDDSIALAECNTEKSREEKEEEKSIANGKPICPHQEIIALYHEILPASPSIRDWTPARAAALRARWNESADRQSLEYWRKLFNYISGIPFLTGKVSSNGRKPFMLSLDWLIKAENFAKVREGRYEDLTQ